MRQLQIRPKGGLRQLGVIDKHTEAVYWIVE